MALNEDEPGEAGNSTGLDMRQQQTFYSTKSATKSGVSETR